MRNLCLRYNLPQCRCCGIDYNPYSACWIDLYKDSIVAQESIKHAMVNYMKYGTAYAKTTWAHFYRKEMKITSPYFRAALQELGKEYAEKFDKLGLLL